MKEDDKMNIFIVGMFFVYGVSIGSFLNVVGLRIPKNISITFKRSHCMHCDTVLNAQDLLPVISYCSSRGKCRHCHHTIHPIYPVMELITGVLFAYNYWTIGFQMELFIMLVFSSLLIIITVSDMSYMLIPNKILFPFGVFLLLLRIFFPYTTILDALLGAVIGFIVLLTVAFITNGGIGGGDLKLFLVIGIVLGSSLTLLTLFLSSVIGLIASLLFLRLQKLDRKTPIPFGPSIAVATLISYHFGQVIVERYISLF